MRAGLVASTVTPGSTAPDVSLRTPAMPLVCCASAVPDAHIRHVDVIKPIQRAVRVMVCLPGSVASCDDGDPVICECSSGLYTQTHRMSSRNGQQLRFRHWGGKNLGGGLPGHDFSEW